MGKLKPGTRPLWRMIRACLEDKRCEEAVRTGQRILTEQQESMSEGEKVLKEGKKRKGGKEVKEKAEKIKERIDKGENSNQNLGTKKNLSLIKGIDLGDV